MSTSNNKQQAKKALLATAEVLAIGGGYRSGNHLLVDVVSEMMKKIASKLGDDPFGLFLTTMMESAEPVIKATDTENPGNSGVGKTEKKDEGGSGRKGGRPLAVPPSPGMMNLYNVSKLTGVGSGTMLGWLRGGLAKVLNVNLSQNPIWLNQTQIEQMKSFAAYSNQFRQTTPVKDRIERFRLGLPAGVQ